MSGRTPVEGIQEFIDLIQTPGFNLLRRFDDILEIIKGPLWKAKEKLTTVESASNEVSNYLPGLPPDYCTALRWTLLIDYQKEVEAAQSILSEINETISKLQSCLDAVGQRVLEGVKSKNPSVLDNDDIYTSDAYCRDLLVFLKINISECIRKIISFLRFDYRFRSSILKHYLLRPVEEQKSSNPFKDCQYFEEEEQTASLLFEKIKMKQRYL